MDSQVTLNDVVFESVLSEEPADNSKRETVDAPSFFGDLMLDRVIDAITADWKDYNLKPLFYAWLNDLSAIAYRQEVFKDLQEKSLMHGIKAFSGQMRAMRECLKRASEAKRLEYKYSMTRLFLGTVEIYCDAIEHLSQDLSAADVRSRGMRALRDYFSEYVASPRFQRLVTDAKEVQAALGEIRYCLLLKDGSVTVRPYEAEVDYSQTVEQIFQKFRHGAPGRDRVEVRHGDAINHIEAQIQDRVALLYPSIFEMLDAFCTAHAAYLDEKIARFDHEIQFYVAYLEYVAKFRCVGLCFCQATVSEHSKEIQARDAFDIALADKLISERAAVIPNDFALNGPERIFIVSGPNQGGKTTFARMIGQLHYLACLGCPVPAKEARLFHCDRLFTHFERQEKITNLRGKLQDDLIRIRQILSEATPKSLIIMNEMFSSTTLKDAVFLSKKVMAQLSGLDLLGVWVTFLDELSSLNEKTVSMVSLVDPANPAIRTYKVERRAADGFACALAIAEKYRLTHNCLKERIKQ